jgi:cobalt/nickel transport system permease protein
VNARLLSPYEHRNSAIHRLPVAAKMAFVGAVVGTVVLVPLGAGMIYGACAAALVVVAVLSRVPARHLVWRLLLLEPFVLGVALLSLLQPGGGRVFAAMLVRSTLCLFAMVLLASTTRFTDLLAALWRLRVPALLVTSLALMYRYLSLLVDETGRLQRARRSRTFADGRAFAWRSSATVAAHLFVRTSERAERIYDAMCARGWRT